MGFFVFFLYSFSGALSPPGLATVTSRWQEGGDRWGGGRRPMAGLALPTDGLGASRAGHHKSVFSLPCCRVFIFQPLLHLGGAVGLVLMAGVGAQVVTSGQGS